MNNAGYVERGDQGAADFATIRGFLSTARKQGWNIIKWNIIKALQQHPGDLEKVGCGLKSQGNLGSYESGYR